MTLLNDDIYCAPMQTQKPEQLESINQNSELKQLFETVVDGGYCIGCGSCASLENSPIEMKLNEVGMFQPNIKEISDKRNISPQDKVLRQVCPFSGQGTNEDIIAKELYGNTCEHNEKIGYYFSTYAGFVCQDKIREQGSSGGMGTWIIHKLLEEDLVDGVIHVHAREESEHDARLFHYRVSRTLEQVSQGAKSRYYPIEMSHVMQNIRDLPGRYVIVGIPCFIKAVRLLAKQDPVIAERIHFCVGLVCGHLKSTKFADMFAWQCGIEPGNLKKIDFRKKLPGFTANSYGVEATGIKDNQTVTKIKPTIDLFGHIWGLGFFKYKACDYCDDVIAETADVVVGDAWLPQYVNDSQGTNIVVVRHPIIQKIIDNGLLANEIKLDKITVSDVIQSQSSGLKHRREGLSYRLFLADKERKWRPHKRVQAAANHINRNLRRRYYLRTLLAKESHKSFQVAVKANSFSLFIDNMTPLLKKYKATYPIPFNQRIKRLAKTVFKRISTF